MSGDWSVLSECWLNEWTADGISWLPRDSPSTETGRLFTHEIKVLWVQPTLVKRPVFKSQWGPWHSDSWPWTILCFVNGVVCFSLDFPSQSPPLLWGYKWNVCDCKEPQVRRTMGAEPSDLDHGAMIFSYPCSFSAKATHSGLQGCLPVVVQSLSHAWLYATPWTAAVQASLSSTASCSLLKFMSSELVGDVI